MQPYIHPGIDTYVDRWEGAQTNHAVLFPMEHLTAELTEAQAELMMNNPRATRWCAIPIALGDAITTPLSIGIDLVYSVAGATLSSLATVGTAGQWERSRTATVDFGYAIGRNLLGLFTNLCLGPILCAENTIMIRDELTNPVETTLRNAPNILCCWPQSLTMSVRSLIRDPVGTAREMQRAIGQTYDT